MKGEFFINVENARVDFENVKTNLCIRVWISNQIFELTIW